MPAVQAQVRFFALNRIKPHAPLLVRVPVNSFEFSALRPYSPGGILNALATTKQNYARSSIHRLQPGLPGYLILFAPLAFESQRQDQSRKPPSPLVFLQISTHSTATPGIPLSSPVLKSCSIKGTSSVELRDFTSDLQDRLHSLYAQ